MSSWNAMTYEGKDTILRVVRNEAEQFFAMVDSDDAWEAPTGAGHWQVRDIVGHIIDTTEAYFVAFDAARGGTDARGIRVAGDGGARRPDGHRAAQRAAVGAGGAAAGRLRQDDGDLRRAHRGRLVEPHGVALLHGPPAGVLLPRLPAHGLRRALVGRQGTGRAHGLAGEVGDLLVPFMFVLWKYTVASSEPEPCELGIRVTSGPSAGDTRVTVGPGGMDYQPGDASDLTVIEFDPEASC